MLAAIAGEAGGVYTTHIRQEMDGVIGALDEAFTTARRAGVLDVTIIALEFPRPNLDVQIEPSQGMDVRPVGDQHTLVTAALTMSGISPATGHPGAVSVISTATSLLSATSTL